MHCLILQAGNLYGGVESTSVTLARYTHVCPEMELHHAVCFEGRLSRELTALGTAITILGDVKIRYPWTVRRARQALERLLKRKQFSVVICKSAWLQAIFGPVIKAAKLPLVYWFHEPMHGRHWLERWASLTRPTIGICNSKFTANTIHNLYSGLRTETLYNPIFTEVLSISDAERIALRAKLRTPVGASVIIQVSRIVELKGHLQHIEALAMIKELPNWICWMVGGAQQSTEVKYFSSLKRMRAKLGLEDRVFFLGERNDVQKLYAAADIYCQPNIGPESFGNVFVEALSACLPVVTTNIGGAKEIVTDSCGILLPPNHPRKLAETLHQMIENKVLRSELGHAGPSRAKQLCDVRQQINKLFKILSDVSL